MGSAMPRKGYTLVEVLMALFLLAFGLLAMLVLMTAGIFQTMRQGQDLSVEYTSENAHSLVRLVLNSQPPTASFQWYYQPGASPNLGNISVDKPNPLSDNRLFFSLDTEGPYQVANRGIAGTPYPSPVHTGYRVPSPDPARYSYAIAVRKIDDTLVEATVVTFAEWDSSRPAYLAVGWTLVQGQDSLPAPLPPDPNGNLPPARAVGLLDATNGFAYRVTPSGEIVPPVRANTNQVYVLQQVVGVFDLGIINWRRP